MKQLQTGLLLALILFAAATARADTTWVAAGDVTGTWTHAGSPYMIYQGDVTVASQQTLTIQPGVTIYFAGGFLMTVNGTLSANGTAQDSIYFTAAVVDTMEQSWRGIFLQTLAYDTVVASMSYCVFEHANGAGAIAGTGGALQTWGACGWITHSSFRQNRVVPTHERQSVSRKGGAMYIYRSCINLDSCDLVENFAGLLGLGGALFCEVGPWNPGVHHCVMRNDTAGGGGAIAGQHTDPYSRPTFTSCLISDNFAGYNGGGVHLDSCNAVFTLCQISGNTSGQCGGGVYSIESSPEFLHCDASGNQSFWGGAFYCAWSQPALTGCVINQNVAGLGGALYSWRSHPTITVSTITHNTSTIGDGGGLFLNESVMFLSTSIVAYSYGGQGIYFLNSPQVETHNCNFALNSGGEFGFEPDRSAGPPNIGDVVMVNANGDSCDTYQNIFFDPQYMDAAGGDYHLNWNSPCIDAGYEWEDPDPDGTMPDIGAYYRDALPANLPPAQLPREVALAQNYPNPFNSSTQITFDLPQNGNTTLNVYDITGREVMSLVRGTLTAGTHTLLLDAANLPSGVYLYRLTAANVSLTHKLVLIK